MPDNVQNANVFNIEHIVDNPKLYGFSWFNGNVEKNGMKLQNVPLAKHEDVTLLRETFGDGMVLTALDGTSRHVRNQAIVREARWADRNITERELKIMIVRDMLGQTVRRRTVVIEKQYIALDGKAYPTEVEALAASKAFMVDQQLESQK